MKNKSLLLLLASTALLLGACGGNTDDSSQGTSSESTSTSEGTSTGESTSESTSESQSESQSESGSDSSSGGGETIIHQDPFVGELTDPSELRAFDERYDEMVDDFTGQDINGETSGVINPSTLRVLVDSEDENEPTSPDAAIYKVGTGVFDIDKYDGIGFSMRITGSKALNLSNLVLGLRGGDGYQVYPINLADAVDPDGDALPELTDEFQEVIVSPQLSIDDANTVYLNKDGTPSELKVLDEILGLHLYALDEECSAVVEIKEVYLVKAGEVTTVDAFNREEVNKADDTCWWRDSTGFIVRRGVTLTDSDFYLATAPSREYANIVLTILGDTTDTKLISGSGDAYDWSDLSDNLGKSVSNAVNGKFYSLVINVELSGLGSLEKGFAILSNTEITIAQVFYTDLEVPTPVVDYPTFDVNSAFTFDSFNREQSGFNGDYDAAITDPVTIAAGLSYQLSYNHGDMVTVDGSSLVFDATDLGADDYINYKACNDNLVGDHDYMIMALKAEDGATLDNFRFNIGSGVTYINQMYSAEGLPVAKLDQADYPYVRGGYTWLVIDLAASGMARGAEPFIDYYYSGTGKLYVDFVAFADAEVDEYQVTPYVEKTYAEGAGYDYAGYVWSPDTSNVIVLAVETEGTIDSIRFENADTHAQFWFHEHAIVDRDGNLIDETFGSGIYYIDLVASGIKAEGEGVGIHVHGDGGNGAISFTVGSLDLVAKTHDVLYVEKTYAEGAGYDYAGYVWSPDTSRYMKLDIETTGNIDSIRFENADTHDQFWFHDGGIYDIDGNVIDQTFGSGTYIIDLVASGIKAEGAGQGIHVHGDGNNGAVSIKVYSVDLVPNFDEIETVEEHTIDDISGWNYGGGMDNYGAAYLVLHLSSNDEGVDLRSLRVESGDVTAWVKDNALIGADGQPFSRDTAVTSDGITLVVDLAASGLTANAIHLHVGGFEESAGSLNISASLQYARNSVGHILATIGW